MKNKKNALLVGLFILIVTTGLISTSIALDDPDYSVTIVGGHAFSLFWTLNEDDYIKMEYVITGGNADLHLYIRNSTGDVIKDFGIIDDYGIRYFNIPYDDTFEIIFKNDALITSRDLELNIDIVKNLTITSPTSMSTFVNGDNYIYWTSSGAISYITIDLYKDGYFLETIDSYEYNDGSYAWYIYSDEYADSSYYQIKISDYYDSSIYDYSDYFTIEIDEDYVDPYDTNPDNNFLGILIFIILPAIAVVIIVVVVRRKHKRKFPKEVVKEVIKTEIIPIKVFCRECGTEILDKSRKFCSTCGTEIIN